MEELNVNTLSPVVVFQILEALKDIDLAGTKNSSEVKKERTNIGLEHNLTDKQISKLCRACKAFYKDYKDKVRKLINQGKTVKQAILECSNDNYNINLGGFVFWENYEARKLFPGRNIVKYSKNQREEIFNI